MPEIAILGVVTRFGEAQRQTHRATDLSQTVRIAKTRNGFTVRAKIVQARHVRPKLAAQIKKTGPTWAGLWLRQQR
jgi:hypothetical protein